MSQNKEEKEEGKVQNPNPKFRHRAGYYDCDAVMNERSPNTKKKGGEEGLKKTEKDGDRRGGITTRRVSLRSRLCDSHLTPPPPTCPASPLKPLNPRCD